MTDNVVSVGVGLVLVAVLTAVIKGGVAIAHHSIAWWVAGLIALAIVFGGFLLLDDDWID